MDILTHPFDLVLARDAQWPLVTRDGRKAAVLTFELECPCDEKLIGWIDFGSSRSTWAYSWLLSGQAYAHRNQDACDLFLSADYSDPAVRLAVQKAHEKLGMEVSIFAQATQKWVMPFRNEPPSWLWDSSQYRLAQHVPAPVDPIAKGHNPDKLKISQVGEGWRLLDYDEYRERACTKEIQLWAVKLNGGWGDGWVEGSTYEYTYRTRLSREELAALDAPKFVRWDCAEDIPLPVCFIRTGTGYWGTIVAADSEGLHAYHPTGGKIVRHRYINLDVYQYSTDRKEWKPCTKEVKRG